MTADSPRSVAIDYASMADLYDSCVHFDDDIPFFRDICSAVEGPVLELMAGTGRVSIPLLEAGVELTCVDYSEEMLAVLRAKLERSNLSARVIKQDVRYLDLDSRFALAILPFHAFAELLTDEDRRMALAAVHASLAPGGSFVCTLHNPLVRLRSISAELTTLCRSPAPGDEGEIVLRIRGAFDERSGTVTGMQILEHIDREGCKREARRIPVRFALLERHSFEQLAREAGFEVEALHGDYMRSDFDPEESPYMIWRLVRPG